MKYGTYPNKQASCYAPVNPNAPPKPHSLTPDYGKEMPAAQAVRDAAEAAEKGKGSKAFLGNGVRLHLAERRHAIFCILYTYNDLFAGPVLRLGRSSWLCIVIVCTLVVGALLVIVATTPKPSESDRRMRIEGSKQLSDGSTHGFLGWG